MTKAQMRRGVLSTGILAGSVGVAALLAGCSSNASSGTGGVSTGFMQVLLDIQGGIATLKLIVSQTGSYLSVATKNTVNMILTQATNAFSSLSSSVANMVTGTTLQTIEGYLTSAVNAVIAGLSGVSGASLYLGIAQTVAALLPAITAFINSLISNAPTPAASGLYDSMRHSLGIPSFV